MNRRNLVLLLAVLAVLGGYVYFAEIRRGQPSTGEVSAESEKLWTIEAEDVIRLQVEQPVTANAVRLTYYEESGWRCEEPPLEATDQDRVQQVVSQLTTIRVNRVLSETTAPLSVFGLAAPSYVIRLMPQEGAEQVLHIGDQNPQGTSYYAQIEGQQPIYLLPTYAIDQALDLLDSPPEAPTPTPTSIVTPEPVSSPQVEETPTPQ